MLSDLPAPLQLDWRTQRLTRIAADRWENGQAMADCDFNLAALHLAYPIKY